MYIIPNSELNGIRNSYSNSLAHEVTKEPSAIHKNAAPIPRMPEVIYCAMSSEKQGRKGNNDKRNSKDI